jgi:hypothetical protein
MNPRLTHIAASDVSTVIENARAAGASVYVLRSHGVTDRAAFVEAVREVLPLDPPVNVSHLDALADSLWQGLYELPVKQVAIVWPNSVEMEDASPLDYGICLELLADIVSQLNDTRLTAGRPKEISVFVG